MAQPPRLPLRLQRLDRRRLLRSPKPRQQNHSMLPRQLTRRQRQRRQRRRQPSSQRGQQEGCRKCRLKQQRRGRLQLKRSKAQPLRPPLQPLGTLGRLQQTLRQWPRQAGLAVNRRRLQAKTGTSTASECRQSSRLEHASKAECTLIGAICPCLTHSLVLSKHLSCCCSSLLPFHQACDITETLLEPGANISLSSVCAEFVHRP